MTTERVTRWADVLEQASDDVGADELSVAVLLALVATESSGDEHADNGYFRGLLQVGGPYLEDARGWLARHRPQLLDEVPRHRDGLLGDARASALVVAAYLRRYQSRHDWEPHRIAAIHKGGAGSARVLTRKLDAGMELEPALLEVERELGVPRLRDYVLGRRHFGGHWPDYRDWWAEQAANEEPDGAEPLVCEDDVEDDPVTLLRRALAALGGLS